MDKTAIMKISLQSDLCVGSGYAYAGLIDSDVTYDELGIPYIPGRRIKGCLKEIVESSLYILYGDEEINNLFGEGLKDYSSSVKIGNAYIKDYEKIYKEFKQLVDNTNSIVTPERILEKFTSIQAQTALNEDGVAKQDTLRYTRVINMKSVFDREPLSFYAIVEYDSSQEQMLSDAIRALKSIGLKRNRGNGSVKCELICMKDKTFETIDVVNNYADDERVIIKYSITNEQPLMLSSNCDSYSEKYITGKAVLGELAARYLKKGNSAEDDNFKDMFISGLTIFTNVYPSLDDDIYYPAPQYINRLKKTKKFVNTLCSNSALSEEECKYYYTNDGNQPKKINDKFIIYNDNKIDIKDVDEAVTYHHSKSGENSKGKKGLLYTLTTVKKGCTFTGEIITSGKYVKEICNLLGKNIYVGKSKSAEYGRCRIDSIVVDKYNESVNLKGGDIIVVDFLSDATIVNRVDYTTDYTEIRKIVADNLGISYALDSEDIPMSIISTGIMNGYLSVWNLRKPSVPVIKAGSCLVYKLAEDANILSNFVGGKNNEGMGQIKIRKYSDMSFVVNECMSGDNKKNELTNVVLTKNIAKEIYVNEILDNFSFNDLNNKEIQITASALGRITLMLKEAISSNPSDAMAIYDDYCSRVESIKSDKLKCEALSLLKKIVTKDNDLVAFNTKERKNQVKYIIESAGQFGISEDEIWKDVDSSWAKYLLDILTHMKYIKKIGGKE